MIIVIRFVKSYYFIEPRNANAIQYAYFEYGK